MSGLRDIERVDVYKGPQRCGELARTPHGARFAYDPDYMAAAQGREEAAVAFTLPLRTEPYETFGVNLHPFFAGLLPEGLRLSALTRSLKTSADDLFSLLVASGGDAVGDVCVAPAGSAPEEHAPVANVRASAQLSFQELFEQSIRYEGGKADATVPGVQPKISAGMISFPLRTAGRGKSFILKLTPKDYPRLVENEAFFMQVARAVGLETANVRVLHDRQGDAALLVERFDRVAQNAAGGYAKLHQEDACQLTNRYPADKYRLALSDVSEALEVCTAPLVERLKLLRLQAFSYAIANGDLHAKNVSVQRVASHVALTPAYDLLTTLPYGDRSLALSMEGRDDYVKRQHFVAFGARVGLRKEAVEGMLDGLIKRLNPWLERLEVIGLAEKQTAHLRRLMRERIAELAGR